MLRIQIPEKANHIISVLTEAGFEAYVVGGCVRDAILGRTAADWDITTNALPSQVKALFPRTLDTGLQHGTVTVMQGREGFEVTTYRIDGEYLDGRHPDKVTFTPSLLEDLRRRDFTVNAMAYNEAEGLVDVVPYKGTTVTLLRLDDIEQRIYMRIAIESMVLRDFIDVCTPILLEKVRYIIRKQTVLMEGQFSSAEFYALDSQLHEIWFKATGKQLLWQLIQQSQVNYTRFRMLDIVAVQNYEAIMEEHHRMFTAIEQKDKAAIEPLVRLHMYGGLNRLGRRIETDFREYFQPFVLPASGRWE